MAKTKITIARIANEVARRNAYRKRSASMVKKLSQLCTLCDVEGCLLIYAAATATATAAAGLHRRRKKCLKEKPAVVWPSDEGARKILTDFMALPELQRKKKVKQQHAFLQEKASKLLGQARALDRLNADYGISLLLLHALDQIPHAPLSIDRASAKLAYFTLANQNNPRHTIAFMATVIKRLVDPTDLRRPGEVAPPQEQGQANLEQNSHLPLRRRHLEAPEALRPCDHHRIQSMLLGPRKAAYNDGGPGLVAAPATTGGASMNRLDGPRPNYG